MPIQSPDRFGYNYSPSRSYKDYSSYSPSRSHGKYGRIWGYAIVIAAVILVCLFVYGFFFS